MAASKVSKWLPDRKVLAGGLASVVAFVVSVALGQFGVTVPTEAVVAVVAAVGPAVAYLVPAGVKETLNKADRYLEEIGKTKDSA